MGRGALEERIHLLEERLAFLEEENARLGKAKDVHEIQNVMSLHEYYHSACKHQEELDAIWARKADDVAFEKALFQARFVGLDGEEAYEMALGLFEQWPGFTEPHAARLNGFEPYSPFEVARLEPQLPEPYGTFSEMFTY